MATTSERTGSSLQAARSTKARCLLISRPGKIDLGQTRIPGPGPDELLIRTAWSCVSPGTETRVFEGTEPDLPKEPFIPGYAMTGSVVAAGEHCQTAVGRAVFCSGTQRAEHALCWGGHTEWAVVREAQVIPLPEDLDLRLAAAAKLAAIAYHGVRLSQPQRGETAVVVGLGPIGLLSALLHAQSGAVVYATDLSTVRRKTAQDLGIAAIEPAGNLVSTFADHLNGGADIVVEATGVAKVLVDCARLLKAKPWDNAEHSSARLLIQASYAGESPLPYRELFMTEATVHVPRDCQRRDIEAVLDLMAQGRLPIGDCIRDAGAPDAVADTFKRLGLQPGQYITEAFDWRR